VRASNFVQEENKTKFALRSESLEKILGDRAPSYFKQMETLVKINGKEKENMEFF